MINTKNKRASSAWPHLSNASKISLANPAYSLDTVEKRQRGTFYLYLINSMNKPLNRKGLKWKYALMN